MTNVFSHPRYRGLLLDTGRNYFTLHSILRIIDGMSYDKLNVFHWHMNEQTSFPFVSRSVPNLTRYGAYSQRYPPQHHKECRGAKSSFL
jgi:hexosaminidase